MWNTIKKQEFLDKLHIILELIYYFNKYICPLPINIGKNSIVCSRMSRSSTKLWLIEKSPQLDIEIGAGSSLFKEI